MGWVVNKSLAWPLAWPSVPQVTKNQMRMVIPGVASCPVSHKK